MTPPAEAPAVIAAIDERPFGGAALTSGTTGGGTHAEALAANSLQVVSSVEAIREAVEGDSPAVVLIAERTYTFATEPRFVEVCTRACDPATPLAQETVGTQYCADTDSVFDPEITYDSLRIGSNKTIIGLGAGAVLENVELDLSSSSNVIVRNLTIRSIATDLSGFGDGVRLWPSDHVWLDHLTIENVGHGYVNITSSRDENQVITAETGYVTLTHNRFDGFVAGVCGQRSIYVVSTNRTPALTLAYNWFDGSRYRNGYFFGPGTWAHVFNNYYSDVDRSGIAVACGAVALAQGNAFESTLAALYNGDEGLPTWVFCADGYFGQLYAPLGDAGDEANWLDATSTLELNDQPTDGAGALLPTRVSGSRFRVAVPVAGGDSTETYEITLLEDPQIVPDWFRARAGAGRLFAEP